MMIKRKILLVLGFIAALVASPSLLAVQFAHPDGTVSGDANYTPTGAASNWQAVGEGNTPDDATFITATTATSIEFSLTDTITDPGVDTGHIIKFRAENSAGKKDANVTISLYEGAGLVDESLLVVPKGSGWAEYSYAIPTAVVTTYNNLSIRLLGDGSTQTPTIISWVELEVPTGSVTPGTVDSPSFTAVTDTTATLGGRVTDAGTPTVTDRGVEWGTASGGPWPNSVASGTGGAGIFTVAVTGLPSSTTIYFRAWADNGIKVYSTESSFTTNTPATAPTVDTPTFTDVTDSTAVLGGTVSADGGANVTERGVVWNTTTPAETGGTVVPMGSGTGAFSQLVSSLPGGTLIYFKAYATNTAGTAYSVESSFTTLPGLPVVDTPTVASITENSAVLGGTVSGDGGGTVTDRGIVWNTTVPAESGGTVVSMGSGLGTFSQLVGSLPTATTVYFRAYATNAAGTAYSEHGSFVPLGPPAVSSPTATSITHNSAVLGGTITSDGGRSIIARGTLWNTTGTPVIENSLPEGIQATGAFSHTRSSLPASTTIYYRAYAVNEVGTSYSAEGSFLTLSEPTVQVSNITFPRVSGKSLRIRWTRGNGEGSIVVLRLGAPSDPGIQAPSDGSDYAANADFTQAPEIPVNTQNFVVYKGSASDVWVTGLTLSTNYSVAIYEYAGTGANTDYLQLTPAEASQATTNVPVHNEDNRVDCSECHSHGQWMAHEVELKDVCLTCHSPSGPAEAKQMFDNHLTPGKNPSVDFVDCGMCHELHNPGGPNTTESFNSVTGLTQLNKSFLRANVDKYVSTSVPPAYLHTDQPLREVGNPNGDPEQLAVTPDRAVEGGTDAVDPSSDTQARGYCQVCHTLTNNHTNNPSTSGSDQSHDGESNTSGLGTETNCGTCHQHINSFTGIGGTASCESCHSSEQPPLPRPIITTQFDRLSSHITGGSAVAVQEDCMVCHDQSTHQTQVVRLLDADDGVTSFAQLTAGASTTDPAEAEPFEGHCLSCHEDGVASNLPANVGDTAGQTDTSPFNGSAAPPIIDEVAWASAAHNRSTAPIVSCVGACHGSGHGSEQNKLLAPAAGPTVSSTDFCFSCHDADGPSSIDIQAQFGSPTPDTSKQTLRNTVPVNQRHDIYPLDQDYSGGSVSCKDCHSPHVDSSTNPVADPDTAIPLATYSPTNTYTDDGNNFSYGGGLDPVNPAGSAGGFTQPDYIQFCLTCHDGTAPAGVTMTSGLIDIASDYAAKQHGSGDGATGCKPGKGYLKVPWTTQAQQDGGCDPDTTYAAINCTTCHGAHGSPSIFNLRESITVAGVEMTVGSLDGTGQFPVGSFSDPDNDLRTYTLPINGGTQADHVYGAWCTFCHEQSAHAGVDETTVCTSAHMHGSNSF